MFTLSLPMEYVDSLYKILLADSAKSKRLRDSDIIIQYLSDSLFAEDVVSIDMTSRDFDHLISLLRRVSVFLDDSDDSCVVLDPSDVRFFIDLLESNRR